MLAAMKPVRSPAPPLLALLCAILLAGCTLAPRERERTLGERIADTALTQLGRPYRYGGSTPEGFDCSGLVRFAHLAQGITVPRTTAEQFQAAHAVKLAKLAPGDLLFFRIDGKAVSHVAIYAGDGRFVHAPQTGKPVETRALDDAWYRARLVRAGRMH
jgi:cell wall-associated NlpC family hydrolase